MQALSDCIKEIRDDRSISTWNEAQAREWIIRPILSNLGWNGRDIIPEYGVETQSVDYALQSNGENKLFIEAKRPSKKNLENHQEQLLNYCFREGVELAILTNGIEWWFYRPLKKGTWDDRKFYTINILEQQIDDIVNKFELLLSRQNIASGKAVQNAKPMPTNQPDTKTLRQTGNQTGKPKQMQIGAGSIMAGQGSGGNVLAALCSFFIPGLGQLLQGRLLIALIQFFLAAFLWLFWMGWLIHLWSVLNAARWRP